MNIQKYPVKVVFHKHGEMIYFSQLDLVRILERALRRSGLPVYFSQGFTPRIKLSFLNGLKLGVEGDIDVIFYFLEKISAEVLRSKICLLLPEGLTIVTVENYQK